MALSGEVFGNRMCYLEDISNEVILLAISGTSLHSKPPDSTSHVRPGRQAIVLSLNVSRDDVPVVIRLGLLS